MTTWGFIKRLPKWSFLEAAERVGFDRSKFIFAACVSSLAVLLMNANGKVADAVEKVAEWLVYVFPATVIVFTIYAGWVGLTAIHEFMRLRSKFRYERIEKNNFVERFNQQLENSDIDCGTF